MNKELTPLEKKLINELRGPYDFAYYRMLIHCSVVATDIFNRLVRECQQSQMIWDGEEEG